MENTYFDVFMRAIEKCANHTGVLGDDQLVFPPMEDYGYESTPRNSLTFGEMGVDGVHYAILKIDGAVRDDSPVIQISPMDFSEPYSVLGKSFLDYVADACDIPIEEAKVLFKRQRMGEDVLIPFMKQRFAHSRLFEEERLRSLDSYLRLIEPKN